MLEPLHATSTGLASCGTWRVVWITLNGRERYNSTNHKHYYIDATNPAIRLKSPWTTATVTIQPITNQSLSRQQNQTRSGESNLVGKNFNLTALGNLNQTYFRLTIFKLKLLLLRAMWSVKMFPHGWNMVSLIRRWKQKFSYLTDRASGRRPWVPVLSVNMR